MINICSYDGGNSYYQRLLPYLRTYSVNIHIRLVALKSSNYIDSEINIAASHLYSYLRNAYSYQRSLTSYSPHADSLFLFPKLLPIYVQALDRISIYNSVSHKRARLLCFASLLYLLSRFSRLPADTIHLFPSTPHFPIDIAAYVCADFLGHRIKTLNRSLRHNKVIADLDFFPNLSDSATSQPKLSKYPPVAKLCFVAFPSPSIQPKDSLVSNYSKYSSRIISESLGSLTPKLLFHNYIYFSLRKIYSFLFSSTFSPAYTLRLSLRVFYLPSLFISFARVLINTFSLRNYYRSLSQTVDISNIGSYVVFFMHYEPERTTLPEAWPLNDQFLAITHLRNILPSDVKLIIKEHPRQFRMIPDVRRLVGRQPEEYDLISTLGSSVIFADPALSSSDLINNSLFTSTLNGSSGWESLLSGKAVLAYGRPWYANCYGVVSVESFSQPNHNLISSILTINHDEIIISANSFLANLDSVSFDGVTQELFAGELALSPDQLALQLSDNLSRLNHV